MKLCQFEDVRSNNLPRHSHSSNRTFPRGVNYQIDAITYLHIYIYISIYDCLVLFLRKQRWVLVEFPHINAIQVDDIQSLHLQYQVVYSTYVWIMTGAWKAIYSWFDFQRHLTERSNNEKHPRNVSFHQIRNTSFSQLSVQAKSRLLRNDLQSHIDTMYSN